MHQWRSQSLALCALRFVHIVSDIMSATCQSNDAERARARDALPQKFFHLLYCSSISSKLTRRNWKLISK